MSLFSRLADRLEAQKLLRRVPHLHIGTFIGILHLFIGILGAGIITAFSLYFIYQSGEQSSLRDVENLAYIVDNALEDPFSALQAGNGSVAEVEATINRYLRSRPDVHYAILRPDGQPYPFSNPARGLPDVSNYSPEVQTAMQQTIGHAVRRTMLGQRTMFVATKIEHGSDVYGVLVLGLPFDQEMASTYRTMRWMGIIALLIVAFTVAEGWLGSVYISRPLARLSAVAEQLSQGDLSARAVPEGPAEVVHLARTLNEMSIRLQRSLDSLRAFVANASHELRTPLTSIKLQVGALRSGALGEPEVADHFLGQVESEIDRLAYMVSDMLDLSHIESGPVLERRPVNLHDMASEVQAFWEVRTRQAGLTLNLNSNPDLPPIQGDPYRLRQLFDNLMDNAIKNTPPGGQIEIVVKCCAKIVESSTQATIDAVRIEVRDTGAGVAPEHLAHIFDRFYRIDTRLSGGQAQNGRLEGGGLGLAIARSIVVAHGGTIGVQSTAGAGATFWVKPSGAVK